MKKETKLEIKKVSVKKQVPKQAGRRYTSPVNH